MKNDDLEDSYKRPIHWSVVDNVGRCSKTQKDNMIIGLKIIIQDKLIFREENGILRLIGKPMDILRTIPKGVKILHILDLNAKKGNLTNLDLYNKMTYATNIEVEVAPKQEILKKLFALGARAVLDLPCGLDLKKFKDNKRLLVGKINNVVVPLSNLNQSYRGDPTADNKISNPQIVDEDVFDYYIETENFELVKEIIKVGKRIFLCSKNISEKDAENAGIFALIRNY